MESNNEKLTFETDPVSLLGQAIGAFKRDPASTWRRHPRTLTGLTAAALAVTLFTVIGMASVAADITFRLTQRHPAPSAFKEAEMVGPPDEMRRAIPRATPIPTIEGLQRQLNDLQARVEALEQPQQPEQPASSPTATPAPSTSP
jgi:hypothetical protein